MPYSDELGREYTKKEARFWREIKHAQLNTPGNIRPYDVASGMGINKQRMFQHLRTWDNDDLIRLFGGPMYNFTITGFGRQFTFEDRYGDIEE